MNEMVSQTKILCRKCKSVMTLRKSLTPSQQNLNWYGCSNPRCASVSCFGDNAEGCNLSWLVDASKISKGKYTFPSELSLEKKTPPLDMFRHLN